MPLPWAKMVVMLSLELGVTTLLQVGTLSILGVCSIMFFPPSETCASASFGEMVVTLFWTVRMISVLLQAVFCVTAWLGAV